MTFNVLLSFVILKILHTTAKFWRQAVAVYFQCFANNLYDLHLFINIMIIKTTYYVAYNNKLSVLCERAIGIIIWTQVFCSFENLHLLVHQKIGIHAINSIYKYYIYTCTVFVVIITITTFVIILVVILFVFYKMYSRWICL